MTVKQHTNQERNASRKITAAYGKRQAKKAGMQMVTGYFFGGLPRQTGQAPKFPKDRKHKQHEHPLRGPNGDAFTLVGRDPLRRINQDGTEVRRMWLGGISAQRGY